MAIKFTNSDRYQGTPDQLMNMMKSKEYFDGKYRALGALAVTWNVFEQQGGQWVVGSTRTVPANIPAMVKKIIGENSIVTQTEKWSPDGNGGYKCDFNLTVKGAPGGTTGWMKLLPVGKSECDWVLEFDIKVPIPLLGKKLEELVESETRTNLAKENAFSVEWLKSH
jgi:hypothetical protein